MSSPHASIVATGLSFAWPDGTVVFDGLDLAIGPGITGLIGANGSGKSTLLRLIVGGLRPGSGTVRTEGEVGYLPQNLTLDVYATVSDLLGVTAIRRALHAIEAGSVAEADFAAVGDDWDIEERVTAELADHAAAGVRRPDRTARPHRSYDRRRGLPAAAAGRAGRLAQRAGQRTARGPGRVGSTRSGPGWPGSCSAGTGPPSSRGRCPAGNGSVPRWPPCCWPTRRPSCCWTSRPTTWIWPRYASSPARSPGTAERSSWSATTCRFWSRCRSPAGSGWTRTPAWPRHDQPETGASPPEPGRNIWLVPTEPEAWRAAPRATSRSGTFRLPADGSPQIPRRRGFGTTAALVAAIFGGIGLVVSLTGLTIQLLPRHFSAAQQRQIMAWEISKRWRTMPAGDIFPASVRYQLPASALDDLTDVGLQAARVGIAPQASCAAATDPAAARVLTAHGCQALLRASYIDESATYVITVGVAVLGSDSAATAAAAALNAAAGPLKPGVDAAAFGGTPAGQFGNRQRQVTFSQAAGPYVILYAAGYADGRPQVSISEDSYAKSEMSAAAEGVLASVASTLATPPPVPHCPGTPGC